MPLAGRHCQFSNCLSIAQLLIRRCHLQLAFSLKQQAGKSKCTEQDFAMYSLVSGAIWQQWRTRQRLLSLSQMCSLQTLQLAVICPSACDYFISLPISISSLPFPHSYHCSFYLSTCRQLRRQAAATAVDAFLSLSAEKKKNLCLNDSNDRIDLLLFRHLLAAALPPQPIGDLLPCLSFFSHFSSFLFIPLAVCTLAAISAQLYWWQLQIGKAKGRRNKREKESRQLKVRLWRMQ